jgi:hypothetical protein
MDQRISADGRFVAFISTSSNLVPNDHNGEGDVFVRDRATGTVQHANLGPGGVEDDSWVNGFDMTPDGRWIVVESYGTTLHPQVTTSEGQACLFDRLGSTLGVVSRSSTGEIGNGGSNRPLISDDARYGSPPLLRRRTDARRGAQVRFAPYRLCGCTNGCPTLSSLTDRSFGIHCGLRQ